MISKGLCRKSNHNILAMHLCSDGHQCSQCSHFGGKWWMHYLEKKIFQDINLALTN